MLRAAHSAAAEALTRAAELTIHQRVAAKPVPGAAREGWLAGQAAAAKRALDSAAAATSDPLLLAEVAEVKAHLELYQGDASAAHRLLVQWAPVVATHRPLTALRMIFRAAEAALWTGNLAGVVRCGALAEDVDPGDDRDAQLLRDIDIGLASLFTGGDLRHARACTTWSPRCRSAQRPEWLILPAETAVAFGRFADARTIAREAVDVARSLGSTSLRRRHCTCAHSPIMLWGGTPPRPGLRPRARTSLGRQDRPASWPRRSHGRPPRPPSGAMTPAVRRPPESGRAGRPPGSGPGRGRRGTGAGPFRHDAGPLRGCIATAGGPGLDEHRRCQSLVANVRAR